jgi:hypothetical protein
LAIRANVFVILQAETQISRIMNGFLWVIEDKKGFRVPIHQMPIRVDRNVADVLLRISINRQRKHYQRK